jgi:hypothetical protein
MHKFSLFHKGKDEPITVRSFASLGAAIHGFAVMKDLDIRTFQKLFDVEFYREPNYFNNI